LRSCQRQACVLLPVDRRVDADLQASLPVGYDFCAGSPDARCCSDREISGRAVYLRIQAGKAALLSMITPAYRTGVLPATVPSAVEPSWVGGDLSHAQIVLAAALRAHPHTAVKLSYRAGLSSAVFRR